MVFKSTAAGTDHQLLPPVGWGHGHLLVNVFVERNTSDTMPGRSHVSKTAGFFRFFS